MSTWWNRRFREGDDRENWENVAAKQDDIPGVMEGLTRLRSVPVGGDANQVPVRLLDKESNIGRSIDLVAGSGTDFQSVLNLEADNKEAHLVTIQTIAAQVNGAFNGAEFLEGRVQCGSGGVQAEATFDWLHGVMLTVAAASVRVSVRSTAVIPAGVNLRVGAFAGYGGAAVGRRLTPQLTVPMGLAAPGAAVVVPIPAFAKDVHVSRIESGVVNTPPPAMIVAQDPAILVATQICSELYGTGVPMDRPMPIVPSSTQLRAFNADIVNTIYRATFGLAL